MVEAKSEGGAEVGFRSLTELVDRISAVKLALTDHSTPQLTHEYSVLLKLKPHFEEGDNLQVKIKQAESGSVKLSAKHLARLKQRLLDLQDRIIPRCQGMQAKSSLRKNTKGLYLVSNSPLSWA